MDFVQERYIKDKYIGDMNDIKDIGDGRIANAISTLSSNLSDCVLLGEQQQVATDWDSNVMVLSEPISNFRYIYWTCCVTENGATQFEVNSFAPTEIVKKASGVNSYIGDRHHHNSVSNYIYTNLIRYVDDTHIKFATGTGNHTLIIYGIIGK